MNVPGIFRTRKTPGKPVWKILNVLAMYQMGMSQEHCPFTCSVFAMYQTGKLRFVPSEMSCPTTSLDRGDDVILPPLFFLGVNFPGFSPPLNEMFKFSEALAAGVKFPLLDLHNLLLPP